MKFLISGLLGLMVAGFIPNAAAGKVKVTGEQHTKMLAEFRVHAGASTDGYVYLRVTEPGGKQEFYWHNRDKSRSAVWQGETYVEGDKICNKYEGRGPRCNDVFRLEDGSFEVWRNGELRSTYKVIKAESR